MTESPTDTVDEQKRKLAQLPAAAQYVAGVLLVILLAHTAMIALWVAPRNAIYDHLGYEKVHGYVYPMFKQSWSIFAPNPWSLDLSVEVRAEIDDGDGKVRKTEWVDLVALENDGVKGHMAHPRTTEVARSIGSTINDLRADMDEDQREVVRANFRETSPQEMKASLRKEGLSESTAERYMKAENALVSIGTAYAHHAWGGNVEAVQFKMAAKSVPDFKDRKTKSLDTAKAVHRDFGWRSSTKLTDQELKYFGPYVKESRTGK